MAHIKQKACYKSNIKDSSKGTKKHKLSHTNTSREP